MFLLALFAIIGILFVLYLGFRVYVAANSGDETLKDDSHLIPKIEKIADEDNAFFDLKKAEEVMYYPKGEEKSLEDSIEEIQKKEAESKENLIMKMLRGESWDQEFAHELISKNQKAFEYFEAASKKKYFAIPSLGKKTVDEITYDMRFESIIFLKNLQRLYLISAVNELKKDNNYDEYYRRMAIVFEILDKHKNYIQPGVIETLVFVTLNKDANMSLDVALNDIDIDRDSSLALEKSLEKNKYMENMIANAFRFKYLIDRNALSEISKNSDLTAIDGSFFFKRYWDFYYKPNATKNLHMTRIAEPEINRSLESCSNIASIETGETYEGGFWKYILKKNAIGEILIKIGSIGLEGVQKKRCENEFRTTANQIKLASSAYEKDKGVVAKSIDELKNSGYLIPEVIVPARIYGWEVKYDDAKGELVYPEDIQK